MADRTGRDARRAVQFVLKATKLCNIRCTYCYELAELSDKRRMSADQLAAVFRNVETSAGMQRTDVEFIWHGGEPLVLGADFFRQAQLLQQQIFSPGRGAVRNACQTNATALSRSTLDFLLHGAFFDELGVSYDPFGGQRVDKSGSDAAASTLKGMNLLRSAGIEFGAITVLSSKNIAYAVDSYNFFDVHRIGARFLPFYLASNDDQVLGHGLREVQIAEAWWNIFKQWMSSPNATPVDPIAEYVEYGMRLIEGRPYSHLFDPIEEECVFTVNTNGEVFGAATNYEPDSAYGNVFEEDLDAILRSPARLSAARSAADRQRKFCGKCQYAGYCSGSHMAHFTGVMGATQDGCSVRLFLDRVVPILERVPFPERGEPTQFVGA